MFRILKAIPGPVKITVSLMFFALAGAGAWYMHIVSPQSSDLWETTTYCIAGLACGLFIGYLGRAAISRAFTAFLGMFRIFSVIPGSAKIGMSLFLFVLLMGWYVYEAEQIHALAAVSNGLSSSSAKLLPLPQEMWAAFQRSAMVPNGNGDYKLVMDTWASMETFAIGMAVVSLGIIVGLYMGLFPICESSLKSFFVFMDKVPPLLLLPILFMVFDTGLTSKVALVVIGVLPGVVLDAYGRTREISRDAIYKGQTLGATDSEVAWSIIFPQIFPKMLGTLRLNFKAAWGYVIAGEFISSSVGIGYTVFISKRYVAMDVIIPYVLWATLIMFTLDLVFQYWENRFRWVDK